MPVTPRSRRVKQKGDEKKEKYPFGEIVRVNERSRRSWILINTQSLPRSDL